MCMYLELGRVAKLAGYPVVTTRPDPGSNPRSVGVAQSQLYNRTTVEVLRPL